MACRERGALEVAMAGMVALFRALPAAGRAVREQSMARRAAMGNGGLTVRRW